MYIHLKSITYNLLTYLLENKSLLKEKETTLKSLEKKQLGNGKTINRDHTGCTVRELALYMVREMTHKLY